MASVLMRLRSLLSYTTDSLTSSGDPPRKKAAGCREEGGGGGEGEGKGNFLCVQHIQVSSIQLRRPCLSLDRSCGSPQHRKLWGSLTTEVVGVPNYRSCGGPQLQKLWGSPTLKVVRVPNFESCEGPHFGSCGGPQLWKSWGSQTSTEERQSLARPRVEC